MAKRQVGKTASSKTVMASRTKCISCSPPGIVDAISAGSPFVCRFILAQTRGILVFFFVLGVCIQLEEQETSIPASACMVRTCTPVYPSSCCLAYMLWRLRMSRALGKARV